MLEISHSEIFEELIEKFGIPFSSVKGYDSLEQVNRYSEFSNKKVHASYIEFICEIEEGGDKDVWYNVQLQLFDNEWTITCFDRKVEIKD